MLNQTVDELAEAVFFGEHVEGHLAFDGRWTHVKLYLLFLVSRLLDYPLLFEYLNDLLLVEVLEVDVLRGERADELRRLRVVVAEGRDEEFWLV